jgi:hypothetical protein
MTSRAPLPLTRSQHGRSRLHRRRVAGVALVAAGMIGSCSSDDTDWETRFWWGAHVGELPSEGPRAAVERFDEDLGRPMNAVRLYRRWEDDFPIDDHIWLGKRNHLAVLSIKPIRADGARVPWADIASASTGSAIYRELTDWATKVRRYGKPIYVSLHHEPETSDDRASGTADYVAAWTRFAQVMRTGGGSHVRLMWIMTDASFGPEAQPWQRAELWYPGDTTVDAVGVDAFNWYSCRDRAEPWRSLESLVEPAHVFAAAHASKPLWVAEFGSVADPADPTRRQQWLIDAAQLPNKQGWEGLRGMLYFEDRHGAEFPACDWRLSGSAATPLAHLADVPRAPRTPSTTTASTTSPP